MSSKKMKCPTCNFSWARPVSELSKAVCPKCQCQLPSYMLGITEESRRASMRRSSIRLSCVVVGCTGIRAANGKGYCNEHNPNRRPSVAGVGLESLPVASRRSSLVGSPGRLSWAESVQAKDKEDSQEEVKMAERRLERLWTYYMEYVPVTTDMDNVKWAKCIRDCHILTPKFTKTHADLVFTAIKQKGQRRIYQNDFRRAMEEVALKTHGGDFAKLVLSIKHTALQLEPLGVEARGSASHSKASSRNSSRAQSRRNSLEADSLDIFERLTDTSKYTGTHGHRFDEQGHGVGLEGRRSASSSLPGSRRASAASSPVGSPLVASRGFVSSPKPMDDPAISAKQLFGSLGIDASWSKQKDRDRRSSIRSPPQGTALFNQPRMNQRTKQRTNGRSNEATSEETNKLTHGERTVERTSERTIDRTN